MSIGRLAQEITGPIFSRHGMGHGEIAHAWAEIVGPDLARYSQPERLTRARANTPATLIVRAQGPRTIEVHYASQAIIDGVNALYGYRAVDRIKVVAAPAGELTAPGRQQSTSQNAGPAAPSSYPGIASEALAKALSRIEQGMRSSETGENQPEKPG